MKKSMIFFILFICFGCSANNNYSDIELTWQKALVFIPGDNIYRNNNLSVEQVKIEQIEFNKKMPLLLYLHGCTGLGDGVFLRKLSSIGLVVIAPDSFARNYRPMQCNPKTKKGGKNLFIYDFRSAELTYALEKISEIKWIDFDNLFLFGVSEGAVTASLFRGNVFNGRIIAQWTCTGAPLVEGIGAPKDEPILAIVKENDPYYAPNNTKSQEGNCGNFMFDRLNSKSIIIKNLTGGDPHDVLNNEKSFSEIRDFIQRNLR